MKTGKIGVQASTVRPVFAELGTYETIRRCAEIGYHCIEISQFSMSPENVAELKRACSDFRVEVAALNASATAGRPGFESLEADYDKILRDCETLGCTNLRIGMGPADRMATKDGLLRYCEEIERYTRRLKEDGIDYYYHTHLVEFMRFDGKTILEYLLENTSLGMELDIFWIWAGGYDPVAVIRQCAGRIKLLHLKDYRIVIDPAAFDYSARKPVTAGGIAVNAMYSAVRFAEIGEGSLDNKACIQAGLECGSEYFLVEQDQCYDRHPLESLRISHDNLVRMGYGDWFAPAAAH